MPRSADAQIVRRRDSGIISYYRLTPIENPSLLRRKQALSHAQKAGCPLFFDLTARPEALCGDARALGQRLEFRPHDGRMEFRREGRLGRKAAVAAAAFRSMELGFVHSFAFPVTPGIVQTPALSAQYASNLRHCKNRSGKSYAPETNLRQHQSLRMLDTESDAV